MWSSKLAQQCGHGYSSSSLLHWSSSSLFFIPHHPVLYGVTDVPPYSLMWSRVILHFCSALVHLFFIFSSLSASSLSSSTTTMSSSSSRCWWAMTKGIPPPPLIFSIISWNLTHTVESTLFFDPNSQAAPPWLSLHCHEHHAALNPQCSHHFPQLCSQGWSSKCVLYPL